MQAKLLIVAALVLAAGVLVAILNPAYCVKETQQVIITQFGKPIGAQQAIKHRLANALIEQEFARPLVYRAAWSMARSTDEAAIDVSLAKIYAGEAAKFVAKEALQVHGAIGYTIECDLHMWMKRAWSLAAAHGDAAYHRERVGRHIL